MTYQDDLFKARLDRDVARELTMEHAEDVRPGWTQDALGFLMRYALTICRPFRNEEQREWAYENGLDFPPDERAWGGVVAMAARRGFIYEYGHTKSLCKDKPNSHMSVVSLWVVHPLFKERNKQEK